jgi:peptide-methionine (R)-S-oxide reductase
MTERVEKSDAEWRAQLTPEQYKVTRGHGTERAGTSPLNNEKREGVFTCVCCGAPLFASGAKFESGTGWPSFYKPMNDDAVTEHEDRSFLMRRTEVRCARCDAHLGHVFPDGPRPTGQRFCMNGVALNFRPKGEAAGESPAKESSSR